MLSEVEAFQNFLLLNFLLKKHYSTLKILQTNDDRNFKLN